MLKEKKLFLLDMDGTIYHENKLIDGSLEFFSLLKKEKKDYVFITNNSSKSVNFYIEKLLKLGIEVNERNFFTSSQATIYYLKEKKILDKIYVVGTEEFKNELQSNGIKIIEDDIDKVKTLIVGFDTELNYEKLSKACNILFRDVKYIATNPDLACPIKNDKYVPDCGAICELLYLVTQKKPFYIGKPRKEIIEFILKEKGYKKEEVLVIGDRLYTDIACAINAKVSSAIVFTGETKKEDLKTTKYLPDFSFDSIKEILKELQ